MKQAATNLTTERLWSLHLEVSEVLRKRMQHELARLDDRLRMLSAPTLTRRRYPPARPKYRNPDLPAETWAGRGKQPRWLKAMLRAGRSLRDFEIQAR